MTVSKPKGRRSFEFDFWFQGRRHRGNTLQTTRQDAQRVEAKVKERARHEAGGIAIPRREDSPTFQAWAETFYAYKAARLERPEALGNLLPAALRFWGRPEETALSPASPCHDLRLIDPIVNPDWIVQFERWLDARRYRGRPLSNQSKNHYRGLLRRMYQVAMLPEFRARTGVTMNPFAGLPNDPTMERTVALTPAQVNAWLRHASYHIRLATAIAALAPKLRLRNVLDLQWSQFDPDPRQTKFDRRRPHVIVVKRHKTARRTRRPLVTPVPAQLLVILADAYRRHRTSAHVVVYHGGPVHSIQGGVKAALEAAGIPYGRDREDGATFHTIRHTAATLLSELEADPLKLMDATGHTDLATTLKYRHLRPVHQRRTLERLSKKLPIAALVTAKTMRPRRAKAS